ncbi:MAG: Glyoxalase/bleomycin resistance protein/dioxygenase [Burkholderiales bacterium]|nr:Glyoxalase/bleomycin resistance protein/dioxygenase [Burkholderiales bacterium]
MKTPRLLVNIDVGDLARAERFYCEALGLSVARRFDGALELVGSDAPICLLEKPAGTTPAPQPSAARDYRRHWTPVHLDFVVEDLEAALARARQAGASLEKDIAAADWGRIALLADPFGNGFCLVEFSERGYDAIAL